MHSKRLARLVASSGVRHMSRAPAVRQKVVPLVKLHDLLDTKAAEPDALVASFKALHRKGVKLPLFFYEKAVELLCQRHDSVRVEYLLRLSRQTTVPPESQLLSRPEHDSFEILSSMAIGMLARYGAAKKSINLWKNLATADFVANRKSLELILRQLAQSKAISSLELPLNLFKVLQNNGWADGERCLHDLSKVLAIHLRTGCTTPEDLRVALEHVKELWNEIDKLSYVSLTLQRAKAATSIAAAQAARRLGASAVDSECYAAATQAYHDMLSAIQRPSLHKDAESTKQPSMLQSIFQTSEYASTFRPGHVNSDEDIALLLERPQNTSTTTNNKTPHASRSTAAVHDQLFGSLVLGQERQELFLSIRRIAEAMCAEHAVRGNRDAAVADLIACMSAFPHGSEVSPLARVAGVGARPGSPAFGFRSLFATSFAEVLGAYQPADAQQRHSEELVVDINSFARTLLDAMHREHVTPTADFHAAWIRALPVAGDAAIEAAQEVVNDAHPVIRNSPQLLEAQVGFYCRFSDDRLLQKAYDLYHKRASEGVRSIAALTQLIMSAMTSHSPSTLSGLLADATREMERNQWSHVTMAEMGDFLLAQLYGYARLREGYKSLRILTRLQHVATASSTEASPAGQRIFAIPRKAYQWTLTALCMSESSTSEEKGIEANPTSTCEWLLQDMLKHGHTCDAQLGASMIKLHAKSCLRRSLPDRGPSFDMLTQFYELLKRGVLNHPPLGEDLVLVKEFIRAALTCEFEDVAHRVLEQRKEAGKLNVELYEPLFYYYATVKKSLNDTEDLLAQLTNGGNKPTPAIIDAIAEGYATAGEVGAAIDWLQESLAQYQVRCTPKGFLRVLEILLENGDADQARRGVGLISSLFGKADVVAREDSDLPDLYPPLPHVRKGRLAVADLQPATLADLRPESLQRRFRQFGYEL